MGKVKEHACVKHKNSTGGNLVLRFESEETNCPLCEAIKADKPEGDFVEASELATANEKIGELNNSVKVLSKDFEEADTKVIELLQGKTQLENEVADLKAKSLNQTIEIEELKTQLEEATKPTE